MIVSAHLKLLKPNPAIYQYLMAKHQLNPNETIFVDDKIENIKAAQELQISGIHFNDSAQCLCALLDLVNNSLASKVVKIPTYS